MTININNILQLLVYTRQVYSSWILLGLMETT